MERKIYSLFQLVLTLTLFIGGIYILILRIPFWSLFLGIPSIQAGIVFIIFMFDKFGQTTFENHLNGLRRTYPNIESKFNNEE